MSRTADEPGQTLNVDLCFVPAEHLVAVKLPAVSGSSGRLVISALPAETAKSSAPGLVFADEHLDYTEAMVKFVAASRDVDGLAPTVSETPAADEQTKVPSRDGEGPKTGLIARSRRAARRAPTDARTTHTRRPRVGSPQDPAARSARIRWNGAVVSRARARADPRRRGRESAQSARATTRPTTATTRRRRTLASTPTPAARTVVRLAASQHVDCDSGHQSSL